MRIRRAGAVVLLSICGGCASAAVRRPVAIVGAEPARDRATDLAQLDPERAADVLWPPANLEALRLGESEEVEDGRDVFLLSSHPRVKPLVVRFHRERGRSLTTALSRGAPYIEMIGKELDREGLPLELAYLPVVESGFSTQAVGGSAVGLWQFTQDTAREYGLLVTHEVDERNDPEKASRAAARLLRDLYEMFESWDLVLAAYNAGAGRIQRARERYPDADFWRLADLGLLPEGTRRYVPHVLATMTVASRPQQFGLRTAKRYEPLRYDTFLVQRRLDFRTIASFCGSSAESIAQLNPSLKRGVVPRMESGFQLRLPEGSKERFAAKYLAMADLQTSPSSPDGSTRASSLGPDRSMRPAASRIGEKPAARRTKGRRQATRA